jgi:hypothetical protein
VDQLPLPVSRESLQADNLELHKEGECPPLKATTKERSEDRD